MAAAPAPASATVAEKEEFKAYLEKTGAVDALTRVFAGLFAEHDRPQNPTEFIKQHLGTPSAELQELRRENEMLKKQNEELRKQLEELQRNTTHAGSA